MMTRIRRILAITLAACMVCMGSTVALAEGNQCTESVTDNYATKDEIAKAEDEITQYYQYGLMSVYGAYSKGLNIDLILQTNSLWSSKSLPCGHSGDTYLRVGCAMCSYAMVLNYFGGSYTPVQVATTYGVEACGFNSTTLLKKFGRKGAPAVVATTNAGYTSATTTIKGAISADKPVVVRLLKNIGAASPQYHFVVAYGYEISDSGSVTIYILDPDDRIGYDTLDQYKNNKGWYPNSIVVVS